MRVEMLLAVVAAAAVLLASAADAQQPIPLRLSEPRHSAELRDLGDGVVEVRTTGGDPYILADEVTEAYDAASLQVFAFEYQCATGLDFFDIYFIAPQSGWIFSHTGSIPAATEWTPFAANLKAVRPDEWDGSVRQFRIDFGDTEGKTVRIRNIQLRAMTPEEAHAEQARLDEQRQALLTLQAHVEKTLISPSKIADKSDMIAASHSFSDGGNVTSVAVVGKELDLATQLREYADEVRPSVALAPPMVAGEGDSPKNHTVVRILNEYGICEVQFLAYPPSVRGGVQVASGNGPGGDAYIVAAPLRDATVRELRVFSRHGNCLRSIVVPDTIAAPFAITVGDFTAQPGDEIAVAQASADGASATLLVLSSTGDPLVPVTLPVEGDGAITLSPRSSPGGDEIIAYRAGDSGFSVIDPRSGDVRRHEAGLEPDCTGVYQSTAAEAPYAASVREPLWSSLDRIAADGTRNRLNVGERENLFWFTAVGAFKDVPEGKYTRHSLFAHIRTDFGSPRAGDPDFTRNDADFWAGPEYQAQVDSRLATYDTDPPVCWEPCFTHRWFASRAEKWEQARDEETGLPKYTLVNRENEASYYGEFGQTRSFVSGSYAPGLKPVESMYVYPQRAFLGGLVERFRSNPEHFVAVEPNHEMEINAESQTTHGDYNPSMIRAFYRYLIGLYGSVDNINRVFGTEFSEDRFDAPRDLQRGPWDAYSTANPYYLTWMRFMNYAIYRVIAGTYREALLAGFPPEAIKCHQIPDHYAIASLTAFSKPASRVTPIDWNLNAGVGYGFTRYGVWYNREHNCVQGAHSSGFDGMVIGEYQSLTDDVDAAYNQLAYMRDHGIQFLHCMNWPESHDRGYNKGLAAALDRLTEEDAPRPGVTGGTGQVRAFAADDRAFDVVSLGTNAANTGLIKSVKADGSWEGSVYVVPFHAHVAIEPLLEEPALLLGDLPLSAGPFEAIDAGNLVEFSFQAKAAAPASVSLRLYHHGIELPNQRLVIPVGTDRRHYRCLVRVQVDTDDLRIELGSGDITAGTWLGEEVSLEDLVVVRHTEKTTKLKKGVFAGERHEGGVTFDLLGGGS